MFWRESVNLVWIVMLCWPLAGCGSTPTPQPAHEEVLCRAPLGHRTARRVFRWKFDVLQATIQKHLEQQDSVASQDLLKVASESFSPEMMESLGDVSAALLLVLLELETRGTIERLPFDDRSEVGPAYRLSPPSASER